ncbi:MAG: hypothetical protein K8I03_04830 [Ignavibacteria bacterium]|nr:hypothetical protein [Ignavibacteria bacterium]
MNKKVISLAAVVVFFALGFLYLNQGYLVAGDKDGNCSSSCTDKSSCSSSSEVKTGGEFESYEFVTDQACCDEMRSALQTELLGVAGVKEVKFGSTCNVSKMTQVSVMYAAGETNSDNIASVVKGKNYDCSGKSCEKDGVKSGETKKEGCNPNDECPSGKQKSKDSKEL